MADELRQFKFRRGTSAAWAAAGTVLAAGEPGYDTTVKRVKIGDGTAGWAALPWSTLSATDIAQLLDAATEAMEAAAEASASADGIPAVVADAVAAFSDSLVTIEHLEPGSGWRTAVIWTGNREVVSGVREDGTAYPGPAADADSEVELVGDIPIDSEWFIASYYGDTREVKSGLRMDGTIYPNPVPRKMMIVGHSLAGGWAAAQQDALAVALKAQVSVEAVGGQTSLEISARYGGVPALGTVSGGVIPASGSVALTTNVKLMNAFGGPISVIIEGVAGTYLTDSASPNLSGVFTRATAGLPVPVPYPTPIRTGTNYWDRWPSFWMIRNDIGSGGILPAIRGNLERLTPDAYKHALILSAPPSVGEVIGHPARAAVDADNAAVRDAWPNMWVDIGAWLRAESTLAAVGITPTSTDIANIAAGVTPESFRLPGDSLHMNAKGYEAVTLRIVNEYTTRGWMS